MSGIHVQIDTPTEAGAEAIWSGTWPHAPARGDTFEIRGDPGVGFYRVTGTHWITYGDGCDVSSAIVTAEKWDPLAAGIQRHQQE